MKIPKQFTIIEDGKETGTFTALQVQARLNAGEIFADTICIPNFLFAAPVPLSEYFPDAPHRGDSTVKKSALPSITDTTHCHVFYGGQQHGPYIPQQIKTMWSAGTLTADTSVFPAGYPDWIPIGDFLNRLPLCSESTTSSSSSSRPLGIRFTVIGVIITIYFAALYDTSVRTERSYVPGVGYVGGDAVVNLGKQQNRLIGVIVGLAMSIIGIVVVCLPAKSNDA